MNRQQKLKAFGLAALEVTEKPMNWVKGLVIGFSATIIAHLVTMNFPPDWSTVALNYTCGILGLASPFVEAGRPVYRRILNEMTLGKR